MATYTWLCRTCGERVDTIQSIGSYVRAPLVPDHCDTAMERCISVAPGFSGLANALAGDRHYDGLQATDGTDISSRTKHREYMRRNGLTTVDDFQQTWQRESATRELRKQGDDATRKTDIAQAITKLESTT